MEHTDKMEMWGVVEVMGHKRYAGFISEQPLGGASLVRVDVPETVSGEVTRPTYAKLIGVGSIYCITPTTEAVARRVAEQIEVSHNPLPVYLPPVRALAAGGSDDADVVDDDDGPTLDDDDDLPY